MALTRSQSARIKKEAAPCSVPKRRTTRHSKTKTEDTPIKGKVIVTVKPTRAELASKPPKAPKKPRKKKQTKLTDVYKLKKAGASRIAPYSKITRSKFSAEMPKPKALRKADWPTCDCVDSCDSSCINRALKMECHKSCCGGECGNRRFQLIQNGPIKVMSAGGKGHGLFATSDISAGDFIIEYVGEIIDREECEYRLATAEVHVYALSYGGGFFIDASCKGNAARFINHSCEPNGETQKWTVGSEDRVGVFALRDIPAGQEITFDYNFEKWGERRQKCLCGTPSCRGWLDSGGDEDDIEATPRSRSAPSRKRGGKKSSTASTKTRRRKK